MLKTDTTIKSAEVWTLRVPLKTPVYLGANQIVSREFALAKIETESGLTGWGATFTRNLPVEAAANLGMIPLLVGREALETLDLWRRMAPNSFFSGANAAGARARSILDIALWDIKAKHSGLPLYRLLGGAERKVRTLVPMGYRRQVQLCDDEILREMQHYLDQGVDALKLMFPPAIVMQVPGLMRAAREKAANVFLGVDFLGAAENGRLDRVCDLLTAAGFDFLEDPFPFENDAAYENLRDLWRGMVLTGENAASLDDALRVVGLKGVHGVRWDATVCGGVTGWVKLQSLAESFHLPIYAHCAPEIHAHLAIATGQQYVESTTVEFDTIGLRAILNESLPIDGGFYHVSDEPGLGTSVNWQKADAFRIRKI